MKGSHEICPGLGPGEHPKAAGVAGEDVSEDGALRGGMAVHYLSQRGVDGKEPSGHWDRGVDRKEPSGHWDRREEGRPEGGVAGENRVSIANSPGLGMEGLPGGGEPFHLHSKP